MDKGLDLLQNLKMSRSTSWDIFQCAIDVALDRRSFWNEEDKQSFLVLICSSLDGNNRHTPILKLPNNTYAGKSFGNVEHLSSSHVEFLTQALLKVFPKNILWEKNSLLLEQSPLERLLYNQNALSNCYPMLQHTPNNFLATKEGKLLEDRIWLMIKSRGLEKEGTDQTFEVLDQKGFDFTIVKQNIPLMSYCSSIKMWDLFLKQGGDPCTLYNEDIPLWEYLASKSSPTLREHILQWATTSGANQDFLEKEYFANLEKHTSFGYTTLTELKKKVITKDVNWCGIVNKQGQNALMLAAQKHDNSFSIFKSKKAQVMFHHRDPEDRGVIFYTIGKNFSSDKMNFLLKNQEFLRPSKQQGGLVTQLSLSFNRDHTLYTSDHHLFEKLIQNHTYEQWFQGIEHHPKDFQELIFGRYSSFAVLNHISMLGKRFIQDCPCSFTRSLMVLATGVAHGMGSFDFKPSYEDFKTMAQGNPSWDERVFDVLNEWKGVLLEDSWQNIYNTIEKSYISTNIVSGSPQPLLRKKM